MALLKLWQHGTARIDGSVTVDGTLTDPTTATLIWTDPSGGTTTATYAAGSLTKLAAGIYRGTLGVGTLSGEWTYEWRTTGAAGGAYQGTFFVNDNLPAGGS
jgi:hypothetical protein